MKKSLLRGAACAWCLCPVLLGCGGTAPQSGQSSDHANPPEIATPEAMVDGAIIVDGRVYVPLTDADNAVATWGSKSLKEMSIDELAEAMTARLGRYDGNGGYTMYRALKPDYALARSIRGDESRPGGAPTLSASGHIVDPGISENPQWLLNAINPGVAQTSDPRVAPNSSAYPFRAIVFAQLSSGAGSCSGTYIGPNIDTMLTAAHCNRTNGSSHPPSKVTPGAQGTSAPFGSFSGCYNWWYPSAWDTAISGGCPGQQLTCSQYDYSVIDYRPCGNPTIAQSGSMGFAENSGNSQWASGISHYGYPGAYNLVGSPPDTNTNNPGTITPCAGANPSGIFPFMCGAGPILPTQTIQYQLFGGQFFGSGFEFEANAVTSSQGDSGGPWWYTSGGTPFEIAVEVGDNSPDGNQWNFGRFIDSTVWNFIFTFSNP